MSQDYSSRARSNNPVSRPLLTQRDRTIANLEWCIREQERLVEETTGKFRDFHRARRQELLLELHTLLDAD